MVKVIAGMEGLTMRPRPTPKKRIIYSVEGHTKTGKSSFGLWGPAPIVFFDIDHRVENVIEPFQEKKVIVPHYINIPDIEPMSRKRNENAAKTAAKEFDDFVERYEQALQSSLRPGGVRTIVIDDVSELYDLRLIAEFGRTQAIQQRDRGTANFEFLRLIDMGKDLGEASVVWLSKVKEKWEGVKTTDKDGNATVENRPTGAYVPDGYLRLRQAVQVALRCQHAVARDPQKRFEIEVIASGINADTNGQKYTSADWQGYGPFAWISAEQKDDTIPQDWISE